MVAAIPWNDPKTRGSAFVAGNKHEFIKFSEKSLSDDAEPLRLSL